jgi:hypothetical protein
MADLNPLKFAVAIQDEATGQLGKIEEEFNKLKDKTINVKVEGLQDLQNLLSALQHKQVETLGKDVATGIHDAAKGLQEEAQKAVRASLGQLAQDLVAVKTAIQHDNFTAFSTRIENCAEAVNTLDAAFKKFHVTIGSDAGMKNFMAGLGEVIRNVRTTMNTLEVSKGGGGTLGSLANTYARNVERMEDALFRLQEARAKVSNAINGAEGAGMDNNIISRWRIYLQVLDAYEKKLQNIKNDDTLMNGRGWQTNAFGTTFKHLLSNASDFEKAANVFISAQEKLSAAREKATGMNAGAAAQSGVSLIAGQSTQEIRKQIDEIGALYMRIQELSNLTHSRPSFNKQLSLNWDTSKIPEKDLLEVYSQTFSKLRAELKTLKESGYDVSGFKSQLDSLYATYEKFAALQPVDLGKKLGLEHVKGYTGPSSAATDTQWAAMKHQAEVQEVAGEAAKRHQRKLEELTNAFAQHDAQVAKSQRVQDGDNKARQESAAALRKQAQELVKARMEMLRTQSADLGKLLSMGRGALGSEQYDAVRNALRGVREEMRQIEGVMQRMDSYSTRSLFSIGRGTNQDYSPLVSSTKKLIAAKEQAAQASNQMTAAEQRLAQALNQTTESAKGQSQVLADLKSMATQYLGVWGGQQFLHNIIEIGGQLEMQRLSISAILQNTAQANELFDKIKHLATQSPFGVVQLDQMTKQLTAYGFKYNELYDMTKRLADISAATGTDVSRLALALGHVRSEAALSGYTLRQFSMANVPLLEKLSEKLGKTTKEIRDMVKKKEVSYDDVVGVLKDLTNEGGMFYNMQEVISESVKAKFKNVKDAMDIMYGEMAEGAPGDALKEVANVLMEVTKNWKDAATILGTGAAVWGIHRAAIMLYTKVLGQANYTTLAAIANSSKQVAMNNTLAWTYRSLTASEKSHTIVSQAQLRIAKLRQTVGLQLSRLQALRIAQSRREIVMGLAVALSEKKLVAEDISRQVALGKVTKAEALRAIGLSKLSAAEKAAAVQMVNNTRILGFWGKAGYAAALGIRAIGTALKSLVFNPAMLAMAGITAVMELWQRNKQELERAGEIADSIRERSNSAMQATKAVMQSSKMEFEDANGNKISPSQLDFQSIAKTTVKVGLKFDEEEAKQVIDEMANYIRQYSATPNEMLNNAFFDGDKMRSKEEQFRLLAAAVGEVAKAQYGLHDIGDVFENAINATNGGWFNDDIVENINDYEKAVKNYNRTFAEMYREHGRGVDKIVKAVEKSNSAFATAVSGMNTYGEKFKFLIENMKDFSGAYNTARKSVQYSDIDLYDFLSESQYGNFDEQADKNWAKSNMDDDLETFFTHIEAELNNKGQKIGELTQAQQQDLLLGFTDFLGKTKVTTKETTDYLKEKFAERFQLNLDVDDEKFQVKVDEVTKILNGLVEGDWKVDLTFVEHIDDAIEEARKRYKLAKEFFEKTKQIRLKFGIDLEMGQLMDDATKQSILGKIENEDVRAQVAKVIDGLNQASTAFNKDTEASNNLGFSLEDPNKKKSGHKAYKDEFAKRWDERIRIMKEAYGWYDKWEKKVGNDAAIAETNSKYEDIFKEWRTDKVLPMDFDVNEIADYTKYVEKIRDDALKRYQAQKNDKSKNSGQEALRVYRQAVALLNDVKFDNFVRAAEKFKSIIDQTISDLNERWEIFNTVRTATGDVGVASRIAGFGAAEKGARTSADAMRNELLSLLRNAGGENLVAQIPLDIHLDEEGLRSKFEAAIPQTDDADKYKKKIDGLIKAYQEWQKLQRQVLKDDALTFANLIGAVVSYEEELKKVAYNYDKQKASLDSELSNGAISRDQYDRALKVLDANKNQKELEMSSLYITLMKNSLALTKREVVAASESIKNSLNERLRVGTITAKEYAAEMKKLEEIVQKFDENSFFGKNTHFTAFMQGGLKGSLNFVNDRIEYLRTSREQTGITEKEAEELEALEKMQDKLSSAVSGLRSFSTVLQIGTSVLDGFQKSAQSLSEMFDALGNENASNFWSDVSATIGGLSSIFSPVNNVTQNAMSGNIGGLISSAISAPIDIITGPITAFSRLHDAKIERQIEELRKDVQSIEANTGLIMRARERTLGYDNGNLRRIYQNLYAPNQTQAQKDLLAQLPWMKDSYKLQGYDSKAQRAMYEYYSKNSSGTGYQQEYQNLLDEREDYLEILDKQESKKKKSQSDIDEAKAKIAELDDQIMNFTQDLAKELWNIDIKGWADQLSDALSSAFENGESMAKAYKETVTSILQQVMNKMMQLAILEPMFQSLQDRLFGNAEKNISGVFDPSDPMGSMSKVTAMITDFFGKGGEGEKTITAATEFMTAFQRGLENAGLSVLNESSNALTSSVQGTSEETAGLLAGYVNALRQDVALNRILLAQFVSQLWPEYIESLTGSVTAITHIDTNVQIVMEMMRDGSGAFFTELSAIRSRLDNVVTGIDSLSVR